MVSAYRRHQQPVSTQGCCLPASLGIVGNNLHECARDCSDSFIQYRECRRIQCWRRIDIPIPSAGQDLRRGPLPPREYQRRTYLRFSRDGRVALVRVARFSTLRSDRMDPDLAGDIARKRSRPKQRAADVVPGWAILFQGF